MLVTDVTRSSPLLVAPSRWAQPIKESLLREPVKKVSEHASSMISASVLA